MTGEMDDFDDDCICTWDYDHARGCRSTRPVEDCPCKAKERVRLWEQWCPTHGVMNRWPNRGDYWNSRRY